MELTPEEKITLETYDAKGKHWAALHSSPGSWKAEVEIFRNFLPEGKILEIGSGGGRDAKELIAAGYGYTGTDVSQGLLQVARAAVPDATFLHQSVYDLNFPAGTKFDGFWACAVLLHVPKAKIDQALQRIRKFMRSGAVGFIALKEGEGERMIEQNETGEIYKRFFVFYSEAEFRDVLSRNDFEILKFKKRQQSQTTWLCFFVTVN